MRAVVIFFGFVVMVAGGLILLVSVCQPIVVPEGDGYVHNLGLVCGRLAGMIFGGTVCLFGLIVLVGASITGSLIARADRLEEIIERQREPAAERAPTGPARLRPGVAPPPPMR